MEPLLGKHGDASQREGTSIFYNLILGTGFVTQFGLVALVATVWTTVFTNDIMVFSGHPLSQSIGVFAVVQSILILQPTQSPGQKAAGQRLHAALHAVSFLALAAGFTVIMVNKSVNGLAHFHSAHGYIGVAASAVILLQYLVGLTMWATPSLYGGEDRAKAVWKYHRWSGYAVVLLLLAAVVSAAKTPFVEKVLGMPFWLVALSCALVLAGLLPRIKKRKLGFRDNHVRSQ